MDTATSTEDGEERTMMFLLDSGEVSKDKIIDPRSSLNVPNWCRCIDLHIFLLAQATSLR